MDTVWLIGKRDRGGVPQLLPQLLAIASGTVVVSFQNLREALEANGIAAPDIVVVFQHYLDEFSPQDADNLIGVHPLTNFIVALGPWCQSLRRSNPLWPEAVVSSHHSLLWRLAEALEASEEPPFRFPLSSSHDEQLRLDHQRHQVIADRPAIVVVSDDLPLQRSVSLSLRALGAMLLPFDHIGSADSAVVDLDPVSPMSLNKLSHLKSLYPRVRLVGLTAWPSHDLTAQANRHGADFVITKPYDLAEIQAVFTAIRLSSTPASYMQRAA